MAQLSPGSGHYGAAPNGMDIRRSSGEAGEMPHWPTILLATGLLFAPSVAAACLYPPPAPREAGETENQYSARSKLELDRFLLEIAREREASYLDEAENVHFARVVRSEKIMVDGSPLARRAVLNPVQSVKGRLPNRRVSIKDRELTSCGLSGDGPATTATVGQMIVVYDGVRNQGMNYRSRLYATLAESAQHRQILDAWNRWKANTSGTRKR
jgi:hypothetical protein